jgi:hypothetical protein
MVSIPQDNLQYKPRLLDYRITILQLKFANYSLQIIMTHGKLTQLLQNQRELTHKLRNNTKA